MSVSLIDATEEVGNLERVEQELSSAVTGNATARSAKEAIEDPAQPDDSLPTKLRGKTPEEMAQMYVNLESAYGRMANDLGTQRKLTDRLLDLKRETDLGTQVPPVKVTREELLSDNPTEALDKFVDSRVRARTSEVASRLDQMEAGLAQAQFLGKHSDYVTFFNNPEFVQWAQATPYRVRVASAAARGDWAAADELLSDFKERKQATAKIVVQDEAEDEALTQARSASLETSRPPAKAGGGKVAKVYRRADLIRLRMEKPDSYYDDGFQQEIIRAYSEGRVK